MPGKIFQRFTGEKKYFSIVILIIFLLVLSAVITPILIDRSKNNWNNDLPSLIVHIENSSISLFRNKENDLITKSTHLKNYIRENLEPKNFSYRSLVRLVNDKEFENVSVEVIAPNGRLIAWNKKIALPPESLFPLPASLGEDFFYTGDLTTYLCIIDSLRIENDNFYTIISIPVEKHYSLQNQYFVSISLIKEFSDKFFSEFNIGYSPFSVGTKDGRYFSYELLNKKNNKIGEVTFAKPVPEIATKNMRDELSKFQSTLTFIVLIFLTLGFRGDFKKIKFHSLRLLVIIIYTVIIRVLFYLINFPSNIMEGAVKDPSYFSSAFGNGLVKSPIEFLITSIMVLVICLELFRYIIYYVKSKRSNGLNKKIIPFLLLIFIIIFLLTIRGLGAAVRSIIFDSTLRYFKEPNLIPDIPSLMMNLILLIIGTSITSLLVGYFLIFISCLSREAKKLKNLLYLFLITQICGLIYLFVQNEPLLTPFLSVFIITFIFSLGYYIYNNKLNFVYTILFIAITGSIISISLLIYFNQALEKESLKTTALELNRPNDNLIRFILTETLINSSKDEGVINSLIKPKSNYSALAFKIWSRSALQKESINSSISILDVSQKELASFKVGDLSSNENYSYGIMNLTSGSPLIFEKNDKEQNLKTISGIIPVVYESQIIGFITALIEIDNKSIGPLNVPDFLESQNNYINTVIDPSQLLVFRFEDAKLINVIGDIYPSRDQLTPIFDAKYSNDNESWVKIKLNGEDYLTYLLKDNSGGIKITAVLLKVKDISWNLFNFFKIFILHSLFVVIALCIILFYSFKNIKYSFRIQLLIAFLLVSLIPIILLAIYNRQIVSTRSEEAIASELHEKIDYIEKDISSQNNLNDENLIQKFEHAGSGLGITFSVYDESDEIYSSKEQYYNSGIFSKKLNPKIFYYLNYLSYREYLTNESIDNFTYNSFYKKLNIDGKIYIVGVNDAFNKVKVNLSAVEIDVFLFGIYSFAILIIIILSTILADKISLPIRILTQAMSSVKQGDLDIRIVNKEKGELKDLLNGFNSMVGELKNNQIELAEFERETAWKEMAKQVAHEIKNPLTPMKLSMQQLIISFKDNKSNLGEIFERLSTSILNQIENLNQIASEFSRFARMPRINLEEIDLLSVIRDTVLLFEDNKLKLEVICDLSSAVIIADISQMRRIFINLIRNSIQANATRIYFKILSEGNNYLVYVADNGKGIPPEYINMIFDEKFTTTEKGMGLGLKLIKKYLEDINGQISLNDTSPSGTTFRLSIPKYHIKIS